MDPDNRRPVDYKLRCKLLTELQELNAKQVWQRIEEGLPKLWTIYKTLCVRRRFPRAFGPESAYTALEAVGEKARHAVAFMRSQEAITVAPRLVWQLGGDWGDTTIEIPTGKWHNVLSGERVSAGKAPLGELLAAFPIGLIVKE